MAHHIKDGCPPRLKSHQKQKQKLRSLHPWLLDCIPWQAIRVRQSVPRLSAVHSWEQSGTMRTWWRRRGTLRATAAAITRTSAGCTNRCPRCWNRKVVRTGTKPVPHIDHDSPLGHILCWITLYPSFQVCIIRPQRFSDLLNNLVSLPLNYKLVKSTASHSASLFLIS